MGLNELFQASEFSQQEPDDNSSYHLPVKSDPAWEAKRLEIKTRVEEDKRLRPTICQWTQSSKELADGKIVFTWHAACNSAWIEEQYKDLKKRWFNTDQCPSCYRKIIEIEPKIR